MKKLLKKHQDKFELLRAYLGILFLTLGMIAWQNGNCWRIMCW